MANGTTPSENYAGATELFNQAAENYAIAAKRWRLVSFLIVAGTIMWAWQYDRKRGIRYGWK